DLEPAAKQSSRNGTVLSRFVPFGRFQLKNGGQKSTRPGCFPLTGHWQLPPLACHTIRPDERVYAEHTEFDERVVAAAGDRDAVGGADRVSFAQAEAGGGAAAGGGHPRRQDPHPALLGLL